jgi:hypothetical protein
MQAFPNPTTIVFKAGLTNTGAATVTVGTFGTFALRKNGPSGPTPLAGGEVVTGNVIIARYDGTYLQLVDTAMGTAAQANASSNTGTVAAVSGSIAAGHVAGFADTFGTIKDLGPLSVPTGNVITASGNVQPGAYAVNTAGGPITLTVQASALDEDAYSFLDQAGTFAINPLTINFNGLSWLAPGSSVAQTGNLTCNTRGLKLGLWFSAALSAFGMFQP